jgi:DNA-binding ferritin-like protein
MAEPSTILESLIDEIEKGSAVDSAKLQQKAKAMKILRAQLREAIADAEKLGEWKTTHIDRAMRNIHRTLYVMEKCLLGRSK